MFLYAVSRYIIEIYRGDPRGAVLRRVSTSQFISLVLAPAQPDHADRGCRAATPESAAGDARPKARGGVGTDRRERPEPISWYRRRPNSTGSGLTALLVALLGGYSRSQIQRLIADGHVDVSDRVRGARSRREGEPRRARRRSRAASSCRRRRRPTLAGEALPLESSIRTRTSPSLNKPAGHGRASRRRVTRRARWSTRCCTTYQDLSGVGGELRPGIVHRLDRGTSGLMVVAKNDAAHQELARQFHDREVEKEYIALVWGVVQAGRRIDAAIGRDPSNRQKMSARAKPRANAVTRITRAHHLPGLTLCQVAIHTGRTHQIRVHLSAIGHPDRRRLDLRRRASPRGRRHPCRAAADASVPACRAAGVHASARRPTNGVHRAAAGRSRRRCWTICRDGHPKRRTTNERARRSFRTRSARSSRVASSPCRSKRSRCPRADELRGRDRPPPGLGRDHPGDGAGEIVLVRQYRHAIGRWAWELPAGSLKPGEDVEHAARRECQEEIGLVPSHLERLGSFFPTPGYCDEEMTSSRRPACASRRRRRGSASGRRRGHRGAAVRSRPASEMIASGEIIDLKTIAGLSLIA